MHTLTLCVILKHMKDFYIYESPVCVRAVYKDTSTVSFSRPLPGVMLGYNDIKTKELPQDLFAPIFDAQPVIRVNFSLSGVCEVRTEEGDYIYVKGGYMAISRDTSPKTFCYPTGNYEGIEIYLFEDALKPDHPFFDLFDISVSDFRKTYLIRQLTVLTERWGVYLPIVQALRRLMKLDSPDLEQMRLHILLLFRMLNVEEIRLEPVSVSALTVRQVNFAKQAERMLTEDLARRTSIAAIADQLGVGESSLKNWFRSVFGKNISEYMRDLRIQEAKQLLSDSALSIEDISARVGYENQAKFTSMFHKYCGCTPSTYRRQYADFSEK